MKRILSVVFIVIMLFTLSSCSSNKVVSNSSLSYITNDAFVVSDSQSSLEEFTKYDITSPDFNLSKLNDLKTNNKIYALPLNTTFNILSNEDGVCLIKVLTGEFKDLQGFVKSNYMQKRVKHSQTI